MSKVMADPAGALTGVAARVLPAKLIKRQLWGAAPPRQVKTLHLPLSKVVSTYAQMDPCSTQEECTQRMRELQQRHMAQHLSDIQYNFVVCGDGNIYEGRGWGHQGPTYSPEFKFGPELTGNSVEVALMDQFQVTPSAKLMATATDCIAMGIIGNRLTERVDFYWKTPYSIDFIDTYNMNGPLGISSNKPESLGYTTG